jgi:hypothetical protein
MTKRAVVVGVNDYSVQGINSLAMCVRDARCFYHLLVDAFGFEPANIYCYLDLAADSATILQALRSCIARSQAGDTICFYYAGHGARLPHPTKTGEFYETIIPAQGRWISDHELFLIADGLQPSHINFTCVFDSCHSGGMSAEAQVRSPPADQTLLQRIVATMKTLIPCGLLLSPADRQACRDNVKNVRLEDGRIDLDPDPNYTTIQQAKTTLIAGCRFDELSYEGPASSSIKNGLMTRSLVDLVNSSNFEIDHRTLTADLNRRVAAYLAQIYPSQTPVQRPQLIGQDNRMQEMFLAGFVDCR